MSTNERNIPEQNQPIDSSNTKLSTISLYLIGALAAASLTTFLYIFSRLDAIDNKCQTSINTMESKHQVDHDKIIRLETLIETIKK
jgi:hypothetical protein